MWLYGAAAALAAGAFSPDPADMRAVLDDGAPAASVHLAGWRPELATESVLCVYGPSTAVTTVASEFPLGEPLTVDRLTAECAHGTDVARSLAAEPTTFAVCHAQLTDAAVRERLQGFEVVAGDRAAPRPGVPIVFAGQRDCAAGAPGTPADVVVAPLPSLDAVNRVRAVEVALKAEAASRCVPAVEARRLAREALPRLGRGWLLVDPARPETGRCFDFWLEPQAGFVALLADTTPPLGTTADAGR